jgi:hypothetical protein
MGWSSSQSFPSPLRNPEIPLPWRSSRGQRSRRGSVPPLVVTLGPRAFLPTLEDDKAQYAVIAVHRCAFQADVIAVIKPYEQSTAITGHALRARPNRATLEAPDHFHGRDEVALDFMHDARAVYPVDVEVVQLARDVTSDLTVVQLQLAVAIGINDLTPECELV